MGDADSNLSTAHSARAWHISIHGHAQPHLVFVVGENEYRSEVTMSALAQMLTDHYGFRTTVLIDNELEGGEDNSINGLEALETADLLIMCLRFLSLIHI